MPIIKQKKWIVAIILTFIAYLLRIIVHPISIDTEALLANPENLIQSWESIQRVSLCFLKRIFLSLNLFEINVLSLIILVIAYFLLANYVLTKLKKRDFSHYVLFILMMLTSLETIEAYAFTLQILEISICYFLVIISFLGIEKIIYQKKYLYLIMVIPCLGFAFGAYQSFYLLAITLSCLFYLLNFGEDRRIFTIFQYIGIFVMAILFSMFLIRRYFKIYPTTLKSGYLTEQINYKTSVKKGIIYLGATVIYTCFGKNVINISYLATIILSLWYLGKKKNLLYRLSFLFLLISPFLISLLFGNYTFMRSQFSAPVITSFVFLLLTNHKWVQKFVSIQLFYQIACVMLLFYSDNMRYFEDIRRLDEMNHFYQANCKDETVVFIHSPHTKGLKNEMLGYSFFEWDQKSDYLSNRRIKDFAISIKKDYPFPTLEEIVYVKENMDKYQKRYQIDENILIVNVSK